MNRTEFEINILNPSDHEQKKALVRHNSETFDLELDGSTISILNNGDNSWSLVEGNADQETVNLIGTAIEDVLNGS